MGNGEAKELTCMTHDADPGRQNPCVVAAMDKFTEIETTGRVISGEGEGGEWGERYRE